jgi:hypothetical protein
VRDAVDNSSAVCLPAEVENMQGAGTMISPTSGLVVSIKAVFRNVTSGEKFTVPEDVQTPFTLPSPYGVYVLEFLEKNYLLVFPETSRDLWRRSDINGDRVVEGPERERRYHCEAVGSVVAAQYPATRVYGTDGALEEVLDRRPRQFVFEERDPKWLHSFLYSDTLQPPPPAQDRRGFAASVVEEMSDADNYEYTDLEQQYRITNCWWWRQPVFKTLTEDLALEAGSDRLVLVLYYGDGRAALSCAITTRLNGVEDPPMVYGAGDTFSVLRDNARPVAFFLAPRTLLRVSRSRGSDTRADITNNTDVSIRTEFDLSWPLASFEVVQLAD